MPSLQSPQWRKWKEERSELSFLSLFLNAQGRAPHSWIGSLPHQRPDSRQPLELLNMQNIEAMVNLGQTKPTKPHWSAVPAFSKNKKQQKKTLPRCSPWQKKQTSVFCVYGWQSGRESPPQIFSVPKIKSIPIAGVSWYVWLLIPPFRHPLFPLRPPSSPWGSLTYNPLSSHTHP